MLTQVRWHPQSFTLHQLPYMPSAFLHQPAVRRWEKRAKHGLAHLFPNSTWMMQYVISVHRDQLQGLCNRTGKICDLSILIFTEQNLTYQLPINLHFCFGAPCLWIFKVNLPFLFFASSPTQLKQSHQNQINSIISHRPKKKNLVSSPLTPYKPPVIATFFLLLSTVRFPKRFLYTNCLHFPHLQFTLQPVLLDFRRHHSPDTAVVKVNNLMLPDAIDAVPSSPFWVPRQRTDELSTPIAFFYSPQDATVSWISSSLTIFLLPFILSVSNGAKVLGFPGASFNSAGFLPPFPCSTFHLV